MPTKLLEGQRIGTPPASLLSYDWKDNGASSFRQVVLPAHSKVSAMVVMKIGLPHAEWDSCIGGAYPIEGRDFTSGCAPILHSGRGRSGNPRNSTVAVPVNPSRQRTARTWPTKNRSDTANFWTQPRTLGIYETTITTLQELATLPVMNWGDTLNFFRAFVG